MKKFLLSIVAIFTAINSFGQEELRVTDVSNLNKSSIDWTITPASYSQLSVTYYSINSYYNMGGDVVMQEIQAYNFGDWIIWYKHKLLPSNVKILYVIDDSKIYHILHYFVVYDGTVYESFEPMTADSEINMGYVVLNDVAYKLKKPQLVYTEFDKNEPDTIK